MNFAAVTAKNAVSNGTVVITTQNEVVAPQTPVTPVTPKAPKANLSERLRQERSNVRSGFKLETITPVHKVHILFAASWRETTFAGFAKDIFDYVEQPSLFREAHRENILAFSVIKNNDYFICIKTNADRCVIDLERTLRHICDNNLLASNTKRIVVNALGAGRFHRSTSDQIKMVTSVADNCQRTVYILPYGERKGQTIQPVQSPRRAYHQADETVVPTFLATFTEPEKVLFFFEEQAPPKYSYARFTRAPRLSRSTLNGVALPSQPKQKEITEVLEVLTGDWELVRNKKHPRKASRTQHKCEDNTFLYCSPPPAVDYVSLREKIVDYTHLWPSQVTDDDILDCFAYIARQERDALVNTPIVPVEKNPIQVAIIKAILRIFCHQRAKRIVKSIKYLAIKNQAYDEVINSYGEIERKVQQSNPEALSIAETVLSAIDPKISNMPCYFRILMSLVSGINSVVIACKTTDGTSRNLSLINLGISIFSIIVEIITIKLNKPVEPSIMKRAQDIVLNAAVDHVFDKVSVEDVEVPLLLKNTLRQHVREEELEQLIQDVENTYDKETHERTKAWVNQQKGIFTQTSHVQLYKYLESVVDAAEKKGKNIPSASIPNRLAHLLSEAAKSDITVNTKGEMIQTIRHGPQHLLSAPSTSDYLERRLGIHDESSDDSVIYQLEKEWENKFTLSQTSSGSSVEVIFARDEVNSMHSSYLMDSVSAIQPLELKLDPPVESTAKVIPVPVLVDAPPTISSYDQTLTPVDSIDTVSDVSLPPTPSASRPPTPRSFGRRVSIMSRPPSVPTPSYTPEPQPDIELTPAKDIEVVTLKPEDMTDIVCYEFGSEAFYEWMNTISSETFDYYAELIDDAPCWRCLRIMEERNQHNESLLVNQQIEYRGFRMEQGEDGEHIVFHCLGADNPDAVHKFYHEDSPVAYERCIELFPVLTGQIRYGKWLVQQGVLPPDDPNMLKKLAPEEPKRQEMGNIISEYGPLVTATITQAIVLAIGVFMPDASKVMDKLTRGQRLLRELTTIGTTNSSIENFVAKVLFGVVGPADALKNEVVSVIKDLDDVMAVPFDKLLDDPSFPHKYDEKVRMATDMLNKLPKGEAVSASLTYTLHKAKERQREMHNNLRTVNARPVPTVNLFTGPEGIGKTRASIHLSQQVADEKYSSQGVYTITAENKYAIPYCGENVWCVQEFANAEVLKEDLMISNFNSIVSNMHCNLEGAAVENKMMSVHPTIINMDTNRTPEEIFKLIPLGTGGSAGFMSRMTIWECTPTWTKEEGELPRNARPYKPDFSHIKFCRKIKGGTDTDVQFTAIKTPIGGVEKLWLTLEEVKRFSYREMEKHHQNYIPLEEKARTILKEREIAYKAKRPEANGKGNNILSVCLFGLGGQGKTYLASKLCETFKLRFPVNIYTITDIHKPGFDIATHDTPGIYVFDDVMTKGDRDACVGEFMRMYNEMPSNSLLIWCSNDIPQIASYKSKITPAKNQDAYLPSLGLEPIYQCMYNEVGMYRRAGYHGKFTISHQLKTEQHKAIQGRGRLSEFFFPGRLQAVDNVHCYDVHNRQFKRVSTGDILTQQQIISDVLNDWTAAVTTCGEIPVVMMDSVIQPVTESEIFFSYKTMEDLRADVSSTSSLMKAAASRNKIKMSVQALSRCAGLTPSDFVYGAQVKTDEDIQEFAKFFISKVAKVFPAVTVYGSIDNFGQMYYDGNELKISLNNRSQKLCGSFLSSAEASEQAVRKEIRIYSDPKIDELRSFNKTFKLPKATSRIIATYDIEDIYKGVWADNKDLAAAMRIKPEHQALLRELLTLDHYAKFCSDRLRKENESAISKWSAVALKMLKENLCAIGIGVGIISVVAILCAYFMSKEKKIDQASVTAYVVAKKLGNVPSELEYMNHLTHHQLAPFLPEAIKASKNVKVPNTLIIYKDGSEEYIPDGSGKVIKSKADFDDNLSADHHDKAVKTRSFEVDAIREGKWEYFDERHEQMLKAPVNDTPPPPFAQDLTRYNENTIEVTNETGSCYGLGIKDNIFATVAHMGKHLTVKDDRFPGMEFRASILCRCPNRDVAFFMIHDKRFGPFKDISKKFVSCDVAPHIQARLAFQKKTNIGEVLNYSGVLARRIGDEIEKYCLGDMDYISHVGEIEMTGEVKCPTTYGDCGLPIVSTEMSFYGRPSLVGIHIGSYTERSRSIYAAVYEEDIVGVLEHAAKLRTVLKQAEAPVKVTKPLPPIVEEVEVPLPIVEGPKCRFDNGTVVESKFSYKIVKDKVTVVISKHQPTIDELKNLKINPAKILRYDAYDCKVCNARHFTYTASIEKLNSRNKVREVLEGPAIGNADSDFYFDGSKGYLAAKRVQQGNASDYWETAREYVHQAELGVGVEQPLIEFTTPVCEVIGVVPPNTIRMVQETSYIPTAHNEVLEIPCEKIPIKNIAEFTPDERKECTRDTRGRCNQIAHQAALLDEVLPRINKNEADSIANEFAPYAISAFGKALSFSTDDEVLNGVSPDAPIGQPFKGTYKPLALNKSSGHILTKVYKKQLKSDIIKMDASGKRSFRDDPISQSVKKAYQELKDAIISGKRQPDGTYPILFQTCKKDELLPIKKAWKGRVFEAEDLVGTLITRWVFGRYTAKSTENGMKVGSCRVGMDPLIDFDEMARYHYAKPCHFAGDIGRHDKRVSWEMFQIVMKAFKQAHRATCRDCTNKKTCGWPNACEYVLTHIGKSQRMILNCLVQLSRGMPSGTVLTAPLNSTIVELFYYFAFRRLVGDCSYSTFRERVRMSTYGDDHIVSCDESVISRFNLVTVAKLLKETMGVVLDSDRKDGIMVPYTKNIAELTFISRRFVLLEDCGFYVGALKKESITAKLFWMKRTTEGPLEYVKLLNAAIIESGLHGEAYHKEISTAILRAMDDQPIPGVEFNDVYLGYEELLARYRQYCLGFREVFKDQVVSNCKMNARQLFNHLVQNKRINVSLEIFGVCNANWTCEMHVYNNETGHSYSAMGLGASKAQARENCCREVVDVEASSYVLGPKVQSEGPKVKGKRVSQSDRAPAASSSAPSTSSHSAGGGAGVLQEMPQVPEVPTIAEGISQTVVNEQLLDDKHASTSKLAGGYQPSQILPVYHQHNAITAYFSGTHEITRVDVNSKTARGAKIFQFTLSSLLDNVPKLKAIIALHQYYIPDVILKFRIIAPIGATGEMMVATMPAVVLDNITKKANPMAAIKKMYDFNIFGIEGNSNRTFELANIANQGFALNPNGKDTMFTETGLVCYLHTPVNTTFAEQDTAMVTIILEMALGANFNMSMPLDTLDSIIGTGSSNNEEIPRPLPARSGFVFPGKARFYIGSNKYYLMGDRTYAETAFRIEPNWVSQSGVNPLTGAIYPMLTEWDQGTVTTQDDRFGQTRFVYTLTPWFVGGDIPLSVDGLFQNPKPIGTGVLKQELAKIFANSLDSEVYILEDQKITNDSVRNDVIWDTIGAWNTGLNIQVEPAMRLACFAIVNRSGVTYLSFPYIPGKTRFVTVFNTKEKTTKVPALVHSVVPTGTNAFICYRYAEPMSMAQMNTADATELAPGLVYKEAYHPSKIRTFYHNSHGPGSVISNANTVSTNIMEAYSSRDPGRWTYHACGFADSSQSLNATNTGRGFIPTGLHYKISAKMQTIMRDNGWKQVIATLTDGTNAICEIMYDDYNGLVCNSSDSYIRTVENDQYTLESLAQGTSPQRVDTSTWTSYANLQSPKLATIGEKVCGVRRQEMKCMNDYCCEENCIEVPDIQVDGIACKNCAACNYCKCACVTHMRGRRLYKALSKVKSEGKKVEGRRVSQAMAVLSGGLAGVANGLEKVWETDQNNKQKNLDRAQEVRLQGMKNSGALENINTSKKWDKEINEENLAWQKQQLNQNQSFSAQQTAKQQLFDRQTQNNNIDWEKNKQSLGFQGQQKLYAANKAVDLQNTLTLRGLTLAGSDSGNPNVGSPGGGTSAPAQASYNTGGYPSGGSANRGTLKPSTKLSTQKLVVGRGTQGNDFNPA